MIDVTDRVPTRAGRVKVTHADGTIEYVTLERADEPVAQGTPINKTLFDSIQNWFLDLTKDTEKFIPVTVTNDGTNNYLTGSYPIDPYVVGRKIGLLMPVCYSPTLSTPVIPILTSDNDQGCTLSGTFANLYYAFNGEIDYSTYVNATSSSVNTIILKCPKVKVTSVTITYTYAPTCNFYGSSNNGDTWDLIGSFSSSNKAQTSSTFTINNKEYNAFKLEATGRYSSSYNTIYIHEIAISGYKGVFQPSMPSYININSLGNVLVDEIIEVGKAIQLYYTGSSFKGDNGEKIILNNNYLSIKTGTISHDATIPKTEGFSHYAYFVSFASGLAENDFYPYNNCASGTGVYCSVDQTTRIVTAEVSTISIRESVGKRIVTTEDGTANYIEFAWN